jgi:hypothetical protein
LGVSLYEENLRTRYAEDREYLDRLMDLENLLDVTLSGFAVTSALGSGDLDGMVDAFVPVHRAERVRRVADKRRRIATRRRALPAY